MSILDINNLGGDLDRRVKFSDEFAQYCNIPGPILLLDEEDIITVAHDDSIVTDPRLVNDSRPVVRFFDLSQAHAGDYRRIINAIADGADGVVFWGIDRIPRSADSNDLDNMVYFALKGEDYGIDFSLLKVVAHCHTIPSHLLGHLDGAFIIATK